MVKKDAGGVIHGEVTLKGAYPDICDKME